MEPLVPFTDSLQRVEEQHLRSTHEPEIAIQRLRERLVSPDYRDSMETRVTIVGEMIHRIYLHLLSLKREQL